MRNDFPYDLNYINLLKNGINDVYISRESNQLTLGLGLTSRCNLKCPKCYYGSNQNDNTDLHIDIVKKILTSCKKLKYVNFALEGEPFCYPHIFDAFNFAMDCAESISISTNASCITKQQIKILKDYRFNIFSLSIDSPDDQSYAIFHKGNTLDKFIKNASLITDNLEDKVCFTTVIYDQNIDKIYQIPTLAKKIGVRFISLMQLREHDYCKNNGLFVSDDQTLLNHLKYIIDSSIKYNIKLFFDEHFANVKIMNFLNSIQSDYIVINKSLSNLKCNYPWFYTSILSNGSIFPCCGDFKPEKISEFTFDGIYNHKYLRSLRGILKSGKFPLVCKQCHYS